MQSIAALRLRAALRPCIAAGAPADKHPRGCLTALAAHGVARLLLQLPVQVELQATLNPRGYSNFD